MKNTFTDVSKLGILVSCKKTLIGQDAINSVGGEAKKLGATKVLVITDPGVLRAGLIDKVLASLKGAGLAQARLFLPNPRDLTEEDVRSIYRNAFQDL